MMIHKITASNSWLKRLDIQLNEPTKQNSMKVPKMVKPTNIIKLVGTSVINSSKSPPFLGRL